MTYYLCGNLILQDEKLLLKDIVSQLATHYRGVQHATSTEARSYFKAASRLLVKVYPNCTFGTTIQDGKRGARIFARVTNTRRIWLCRQKVILTPLRASRVLKVQDNQCPESSSVLQTVEKEMSKRNVDWDHVVLLLRETPPTLPLIHYEKFLCCPNVVGSLS